VDDQSGFFRKYRALEQLLEAEESKGDGAAARTLLFCNKIDTCRRIENILRRADPREERLRPLPYHAALSPERRKESMEEFQAGAEQSSTLRAPHRQLFFISCYH
jgi:ATP-dependent RNA helicase DDX18/HAS1